MEKTGNLREKGLFRLSENTLLGFKSVHARLGEEFKTLSLAPQECFASICHLSCISIKDNVVLGLINHTQVIAFYSPI